ncbi:MAG: hypothetical protein HQK77_22140 [Desulfobacterales bacterium]|nr:hypothetical protein [Desulfobacterales bacterium]
MNNTLKFIFLAIMTIALMFGFLNLFFPHYHFERLHIFLFNLCSGGTIILYFSENKPVMSNLVIAFFILSFLYAIAAFLEYYAIAIVLALILFVLVERIRISCFSFFPIQFFQKHCSVSKKFHLASLLCLSIGLIISVIAICNQEYYTLINSPKLQLNTFFLGFSFPLSLITLSVMFALTQTDQDKKQSIESYFLLKQVIFWTINLGVILFFLFILLQSPMFELIISMVLFTAVSVVFFLYMRIGLERQQKAFLISGICFLLLTAITGIAYIISYFYSAEQEVKYLLRIHAIISLYGWNLSGLAVICRYRDFPIQLHSKTLILLHWITVIILACFADHSKILAIVGIGMYSLFLYLMFFSKGSVDLEAST